MLLACSVLIPLAAPGLVNGQTITETSVETFTSTSAATLYSTIESTTTRIMQVHYMLTPFGYNQQTGSFSLGRTDTIPHYGIADYACLHYDYFLFNATAGHEIRVHLELSQTGRTMQFFVVSPSQLGLFGNCGSGNWGWEEYALFTSSYDLDWVVPASGVYAFLFLSGPFYGGTIRITADDYSSNILSSTETSTAAATYTLQSSQIAISTLTTTSPQPSSTQYYYAAIILIIIVALIVAVLLLRTKHPR
jgi:hypothetical protein